MLSVTSNSDEDKKLLVDRDKFPIRVESDNPFVASAKLEFGMEKSCVLAAPLESDTQTRGLGAEPIENLRTRQIESAQARLKRMPNSIQLMNNLGLSYLDHGDVEEAIEWLERALKLNPTSFIILGNIAKAYLSQGNTDKAIGIYSEINKREPDNLKVLNNLANLLLQKNDIPQAKEYLERIVKIDSKNIAGLSNLAMVFLAEGKRSKAINLLRRALTVESNLPGVLNNLGVCFLVQKNLPKAIKHFLAARALDRRDVSILLNLANAYHAKGLTEKAISLLEERLSGGEENQEVREMLAWFYVTSKAYKKALKQLNELLKLQAHPEKQADRLGTLNNIGVVYQSIGNFELAEQYYNQALNTESNLPLRNAVLLYLNWNKEDAAKRLIDKGLVDFPDDPEVKALLGQYYFETTDYWKASELFRQIIIEAPKVVDSYAVLALIEMEINKDLEKSEDLLVRGLSLYPDNANLLNNYAYNLLCAGNTAKAREILDRIDEEENPFSAATRGLLLIKEGNIQEGQRLYNRAKELLKSMPHLVDFVEQKKWLEIGKYYQKIGDSKEAARLLKKATSIKTKHAYFREDAERLLSVLQEHT